jgi:hypothetical protein
MPPIAVTPVQIAMVTTVRILSVAAGGKNRYDKAHTVPHM